MTANQARPGDDELCWLPATELSRLLRTRALSPVELLAALLRRVERVEPQVHAFLTLDAEGALASARQAEAELGRGLVKGPLHGIPVSIKDLEPTAGLRTTFGSKFYEHNVPQTDGAVAERLRAGGAILFGKTNTPHFGHKDMSDNLIAPATRNPWHLERTPGGSSGGAAAALAAGLGPLAHGSDGAGSIRIPAALCGVFGLKPSIGRVPYWPNADAWGARSHAGPLARTVRDAALLLGAMAGPDQRDPTSIDAPPDDYLGACERAVEAVKGKRVAWSPDLGYAAVDAEVAQLTAAAARRFAELGCQVEQVTPPWSDPGDWHRQIWEVMQAGRHAGRLAERPEWIEPSLREMIEAGSRVPVVEFAQALLARTTLTEQARQLMAGYDLLLTPAMPCAAWSYLRGPTHIGGRPAPAIYDRLPFMYPFNLTGWPAASVPCGFTAEGLPVGLQVVAGWHQDTLCLQAAAAFETIQPWSERRPALP